MEKLSFILKNSINSKSRPGLKLLNGLSFAYMGLNASILPPLMFLIKSMC